MSPAEAKIDARAVKRAVEAARNQVPYALDSDLENARRAKIGAPVLVRSPQGEPSFWLVPLLSGELACGFSMVDLSGKVIRLGIFGGNARDQAAWVKAAFFEVPPEESLAEIARTYPGSELSAPVFSFDGSPARWGWMVSAIQGTAAAVTILITPGGWYVLGAPSSAGWERGEG